jgi:hypothetical protein
MHKLQGRCQIGMLTRVITVASYSSCKGNGYPEPCNFGRCGESKAPYNDQLVTLENWLAQDTGTGKQWMRSDIHTVAIGILYT